jgi:hypothetical protein
MVLINQPKPIYGDVIDTYTNYYLAGVDIMKMSTGIYYYRNQTYLQSSPHGWNYLHDYFKVASDGAVLISREQLLGIKYEISKHLMELKFLSKEGRFKDMSIAVADFKTYYLNIVAAASKHMPLGDFWNKIY